MKMQLSGVDLKKSWVRIENLIDRIGLPAGVILLIAYGVLNNISHSFYNSYTRDKVERNLICAENQADSIAALWFQKELDNEVIFDELKSGEGVVASPKKYEYVYCLFEQKKLIYWSRSISIPDSVAYHPDSSKVVVYMNNRIAYPIVREHGDRRLVFFLGLSTYRGYPEIVGEDRWRELIDTEILDIRGNNPPNGVVIRNREGQPCFSIVSARTGYTFFWVGILGWLGIAVLVMAFARYMFRRMNGRNVPRIFLGLLLGLLAVRLAIWFFQVPPQCYPIFNELNPINSTLVKLFGSQFTIGNILINNFFLLVFSYIELRSRAKIMVYFRKYASRTIRWLAIYTQALVYGIILPLSNLIVILLIFDNFSYRTIYEIFVLNETTVTLYCAIITVNIIIPLQVLYMKYIYSRREILISVVSMFVVSMLLTSFLYIPLGYLVFVVFVANVGMLVLIMLLSKKKLVVFVTAYIGWTALVLTFVSFYNSVTRSSGVPTQIAFSIYSKKEGSHKTPYGFIYGTKTEMNISAYYSYLKLKDRHIEDFGGRYIYGSSMDDSNFDSGNGMYYSHYFNHYVLRSDDKGNMVVVSYPQAKPIDMCSMYIYLFVLLWLGEAFLFVVSFLLPKQRYFRTSLYTQIRITVMFTVIMSAVAVVFVIVRYTVSERQDMLKGLLFGKFSAIVTDYRVYFDRNPFTSEQLTEWLNIIEEKLQANVNIYDDSGLLIACSNTKAFKNRMVPMRMNPAVFEKNSDIRNLYNEDENIRGVSCRSFYYKLEMLDSKEVFINAIFLNSITNREVRPLLVNILNIFLLILFMSIIVSVLLYRQIMGPIRLIQDSIRNIRYRKRIENTHYKKGSEVSLLIDQYNQTLDELAQTYSELAKNERQGAWKMIARQVAHELKNPLTPIKLKAQMILHRKRTGDTHWDDKIEESMQLIVSQTEILAKIISEFSSLGKINESPPVRTNIDKMCRELVAFYSCYHSIRMIYENEEEQTLYAYVNYDNFWSVMTNLITNAVSAIHAMKGRREDGEVLIRVRKDGETHLEISVTDDGCGIPESLKPEIFTPNFTTKKNGSGLGLIISLQMIRAMNGQLYFESQEGVGTTFFIVLERA